MSVSTSAPLLNEYKYGLSRRKLLQTITGGLRLQKGHYCAHLIQASLWLCPFLISAPFLGLSFVWNQYYWGLVYALLVAVATFSLGVLSKVAYLKSAASEENALGEEAEEEKWEHSLSWRMLTFIIAPKSFVSVVTSTVVSGSLAYVSYAMLNPASLLMLLPIPAMLFVVVAGWMTACSAHYSLSAHPPPDIAMYRDPLHDYLNLKMFARPVYVIGTGIIFLVISLTVTNPNGYLYALYTALCLMPLGWALGILPPLDALVTWLMEQVLVHLIGGSPMASESRLLAMFFLSVAGTVSISVAASGSALVFSSTVLGFILSHNILTFLWLALVRLWCCCRLRLIGISSHSLHSLHWSAWLVDFRRVGHWRQLVSMVSCGVVKDSIVLAVSLSAVQLAFMYSSETFLTGLAGCVIGLWLLLVATGSLSGLFMVGGLVRSPLHPRILQSAEKLLRWKSTLRYFSLPRRVLITYVAPVLMVMLTGVILAIQTRAFGGRVWLGITTARVFRKIWQFTEDALFELSVVAVLQLSLAPSSSWLVLGLGTQALIVGVAVIVLGNISERTVFFVTLLYSFLFDNKQRSRNHWCTVSITFSLLPVSLATIVLSSVVSSPVFPVFTLPILLPSFPRVRDYWPRFLHCESVSQPSEAAVYRQALDKIARLVFHLVSLGVLRYRVSGETLVLIRFQDRLVLVSLAEKGYTFCNVCLRGLEMQETSCHTAEASQIDDIFEVAHTNKSSTLPFWLNTYPLHLLLPLSADVLHVYSDARNNLAGIIDQHESLRSFSDNFLKSLVWEFAHSVKKSPPPVQCKAKFLPLKQSPSPANDPHPLSHPTRRPHQPSLPMDNDSWAESLSSDGDNPACSHTFLPVARRYDSSDESLQVSSAVDPLADHHYPPSYHITPTDITVQGVDSVAVSTKALTANSLRSRKTKSAVVSPAKFSVFDVTVPFTDSELAQVLSTFPHQWLTSVTNSLSLDSLAVEQVKRLAAACFFIMDCSASRRTLSRTTPGHLFRGFVGKFPSVSSNQRWLENSGVFPLAQQAYRYGVKLLYDEAVLGPATSEAELTDCLQEYDRDWYVGSDGESEWQEHVLDETTHLFSLGHSKQNNTYTAHILSLQDEVAHVGLLSSAAVEAIWTNLSWELRYLTNDDEERYSIQAHPRVLRNLSTQAADIPLGYYVYSSPLITVPAFQ